MMWAAFHKDEGQSGHDNEGQSGPSDVQPGPDERQPGHDDEGKPGYNDEHHGHARRWVAPQQHEQDEGTQIQTDKLAKE
jgi:hypothetical protein